MSRKVKLAEFKHDTISYYTQGEGQSIVLINAMFLISFPYHSPKKLPISSFSFKKEQEAKRK